MNSFIERLSSLNPKTVDARVDVGRGGRPTITTQELSGALTGCDSNYSELVINVVHRNPTSSEARVNLVYDCIKQIKSYEKTKAKLFKETKQLNHDESVALANMALDWVIAGFHNENESFAADRMCLYMSRDKLSTATWRKKYEPIFISVLDMIHIKLNDVCNQAKENTGIYE